MVDSPTARNRLRKQELGTNTNTWGDTKLNEVLDALDQAMDGVESIVLTGDKTLTSSNYTIADEAKNRVLVFTGSLTGPASVIVPSVEHTYLVFNNAGAVVTVKTAAGTGVAIPAGYMCWVYCDGPNVLAKPMFVNGKLYITPGTENSQATTVAQVSALIAAQLTSGDGSFLVSADDTTRKFLESAIQEGTGIGFTVNNPGANETLTLAVDTDELEELRAMTGKVTATLSSGTTAMIARRRYRIGGTATGTLPTLAAGDFVIVEFAVGDGVTGTVGRNSQTIDGASADDTYEGDGGPGPVIRYDYAGAGAVTSRLIEGISA